MAANMSTNVGQVARYDRILPHGGHGASGTGTDLSVLALHEYQRPKTITARISPWGRQ